MKEEDKRIAKNTLFLYLRMILVMGISLYTSRIVLKALGVDDFGIYNVIGGVIVVFSLLNSSISSATQRYITYSLAVDSPDQTNKIFNTALFIHIALSVIIVLMSETVGLYVYYHYLQIPSNRIVAGFWTFQFSILTMIMLLLSIPYNAVIIAHEKMNAFAYISIFEVLFKLIIAISLLYVNFDKLIFYSFLMFVSEFVIRQIYIFYCKRNFVETIFKFVYEPKLLKEMSKFAGWNIGGGLATLSSTQGLNIMFNIFFGPTVNAARGVAVQVQSAISNFCINFQNAINPQIIKSSAQEDIKRRELLIHRSSRFSFYLVLMIAFPIFCEIDFILHLWLVSVPQYTSQFVRIMIIISASSIFINPVAIAVEASGKIRNFMLINFIRLVTIPVTYFMFKNGMSPVAAFYVDWIVLLVSIGLRMIVYADVFKISIINYLKSVLAKTFLVLVLLIIIASLIYRVNELSQILILILLFIISIIVIYVIGLTNDERKFFNNRIVSYLKINSK